jgi:hypothetical protein
VASNLGQINQIRHDRAAWPTAISVVCGLVTKFNDPMPDDIYQYLSSQAGSSGELADRSYGNGARCLAGLIRDRKALYQLRREQ